MRPIRRKKIGANDLSYSAGDSKFADLKGSVQQHGYSITLSFKLNYNGLTERQAQQAHKLLFALASDALSAAQEKRASNAPLFPLEELVGKDVGGQGINTR